MKKNYFLPSTLLLVLLSTSLFVAAQSGRVGIGTSNPEQKLDVAGSAKANDKVIGTRGFVAGSVTTDTAKAVFSTDITNKGFYIPRLTTTQKNSLGLTLNATNKGLLVFDTTLNRTDFWDGTAWKAVGDGAGGPPSGAAGGDLTGNYPTPSIANNAVNSTKIADGTIIAADLNQMGAGTGQVLQWNGSAWVPTTPSAGTVTSVSGTAPIASSGGNTPTISITPATGSAAGSMSATDKAKLDAATAANNANTVVMRDASGNFSAGVVSANLDGQWQRIDDRTIAPSDINSGYAKFGFTSWANNNSSPYADFLHLRSYTDATGGNDNLVMFRKDQIGMRIYQQAWNSATPYSSYKDVAFQQDIDGSFIKNQNSLAQSANFWINGNGRYDVDKGPYWAANTDEGFIRFHSTGDAAGESWLEIGTNDNGDEPITFTQSSSERMRIHTNGFVGIGTTSPAYRLDVTGDVRASREVIGTLGSGSGQFRAVAGNFGSFIRNDGTDTYIPLLTASGDQYGSWNTLRPIRVNNTNGDVFIANSAVTFAHSNGATTLSNLAGTGNREVYAEASGLLKAGRALGSVVSFNSSMKPSPDDLANSNTVSGDDVSTLVNLGFNFTIEGTTYTQVTISSNGWVAFGDATAISAASSRSNLPLPTATFSMPVICAYWDDLVTEDDHIDVELLGTAGGRIFIIQGEEYVYGNSGNDVNWQVVIHESGLITVKYFPDIAPASCGQSATIGYQGVGGSSAKAYMVSCNARVIDDNQEHDQSWSVYIPQAQ